LQRTSDDHLMQSELDLLLSPELFVSSGRQDVALASIHEHLSQCAQCRKLLDREAGVQSELNQLRHGVPAPLGPNCPAQEELQKCAAGTLSQEESEQLLHHVATCEHCGPLFRNAVELFADEPTAEEKEMVGQLVTSAPSWQRALALRLEKGRQLHIAPKRFTFRSLLVVTAAAAVCMVALVAIRYNPSNDLDKVNKLLNDAYGERRVSELRLTGAAYAPVAITRGSPDRSPANRPTTLLEAELLIARQLKKNPDDVRWQVARARADVVNGSVPELDVANLEHALAKDGTDEIRLDLASAYFQLAESTNQPSLYGRAVNLLGELIAKTPDNRIALFNRAIIMERLYLYHQAEEDWLKYLELDRSSEWAEEARSRLSELRKKIQKQKDSSSRPLLAPEQFWSAFQKDPKQRELLSEDTERYRDLALQTWLVEAFPQTPGSRRDRSIAARNGLLALAQLFRDVHKDTWLGELMGHGAHDTQFASTVSVLSEGYRDDAAGRFELVKAISTRKPNPNNAVRIEAQWQFLFAERLSLNSYSCLPLARTLWNEVRRTSYQWLKVRTLLDYAQCADHNNRLQLAKELNTECLRLAVEYRFPDLLLRATKVAADLDAETNDADSSMSRALSGLATFWGGNFSYMSGYNLLITIDEAAASEELWYLDAKVIAEALQLLGRDPDEGMRAVEQHRLAKALLLCKDLNGATHNLIEAKRLLEKLPDNKANRRKLAEIEIDLARLDLQQGRSAEALAKLLSVKEEVRQAPDDYLLFEFFVAYGKALRRTGSRSDAEIAFGSALTIAQKGLRDLQEERDRLRWIRHCSDAYREIVRAELNEDSVLAFKSWESFKAASLPVARHTELPQTYAKADLVSTSTIERLNALRLLEPGTLFIAFSVFDDGVSVWTYDGSAVQQNWIAIPGQEIERLSERFASDCSDPQSSLSSLNHQGKKLFQILFSPLSDRLASYSTLLIEPDGALEGIPFGALMDEREEYFGDRYSFIISPGLFYSNANSPPESFSRDSRALVVADASSHPELGLVGLPGTEDEARSVAISFSYPRTLIGKEATSSAVMEILPGVSVFHFAGHAVVSAKAAGMVLHGHKAGEGSSFLTADDLSRHQFKNLRLVVLSACSSARGTNGAFSDSESVARTLVAEGVRDVVASRWPVNSISTTILMESFYRHLISGDNTSRALQGAERDLHESHRFRHPFYWASFSVFGTV
jgi:CHAT domain-containing protein